MTQKESSNMLFVFISEFHFTPSCLSKYHLYPAGRKETNIAIRFPLLGSYFTIQQTTDP